MDDALRSRQELIAELDRLRRRLASLEADREAVSRVLHGDPRHSQAPLVEQVPAVVWTTDPELRLTWLTGGGLRAIGPDRELGLGTHLFTFMQTDAPDTPSIAAHRSALNGVASSYEQTLDDAVFTAHVGPLYAADGEIAGCVGVAIEITARVRAERELRAAHDRLRTLSGLIPICMHCKSVRNDGGFWEQVESYVREHSNAEFTHAICPDCMKRALDGGGVEA